jgi:nucleoside-diphosphate-sugar epimerase
MFIDNALYQEDVVAIANYSIDWGILNNKSILITGATGLIGTFLVDVLMYRNITYNDAITIYAIGRNREKALLRFNNYFNSNYFIFIQHDIQEAIELDIVVDYIIHGASNTHPLAYANEPVNTILLSIIGTKNILKFAKEQKAKRVLFISTVEIYGENRGDREEFTEDCCGYINCNTLRAGYPEGKRAAEALCQAYIKEDFIDVVIARSCRVYGPAMDRNDSKVIAQFLQNACDGKDIVLKSDGKQQYSYCYVADVCSALLVILLNGKTGEAYNIAEQNCDMSLLQIAEILSNYINKGIVYEIPSSVEASGYSKVIKALLDSMKLQKIGWSVQYPIREGLLRSLLIVKETADR